MAQTMATLPQTQTNGATITAPALDNSSLLDRIVERQADVASRYQPVMDIDDSIKRFEALKRYIERVLVDGVDYGKVPGVEKPFLFKSGAQKLCMLFGYVPHYESRVQIEDWSGDKFGEPLFYYQYACVLTKDGKAVGEGIGSANSWESKYRYRWVAEEEAKRIPGWENFPKRAGTVREFTFAVEKAETSGPYGKPAAYWQRFAEAIESGEARKVKKKIKNGEERDAWEIGSAVVRVPNDQFPDVINTCQKQGEKRSYVEATLSATGASQFFTQDEDATEALGINTGGHPIGTQAAANYVAQQKIANGRGRQSDEDIQESHDLHEDDMRHVPSGREQRQSRTPTPAPAADKSKDFSMLKHFKEIKSKIGTDAYYRILGANGYTKSDEITDVSKGRSIYAEMRAELKDQQERAMREPESEPQPAAAMADDATDVWPEGRE